MVQFVEMLLPFFQLSLAIRNVWPKRMSLKTFFILYMLLLLAGMPAAVLHTIRAVWYSGGGLHFRIDCLPGYCVPECLYGHDWVCAYCSNR